MSAAGISCWFSGLCRPEGFFVAGLMIAASFLIHAIDACSLSRLKDRALPLAVSVMATFVIPTLLYQAWRYSYFGDLFPNSYYIKIATYSGNMLPGLAQLLDFGRQPAVLFLLALVLIRRKFDRFNLLLLPPLLFAATFYLYSEHIMAFNHRFYLPYIPFLAALAAPGIERLISGSYRMRFLKLGTFATLFYIAFVVPSPIYKDKDVVKHAWPKRPSEEETHFMLGKRMAKLKHHHQLLVVGPDAGAMPYFSETKWIDSIGLNDNFLARNTRASKNTLIDYLFERKPDIFILCKAGGRFRRGFPGPLGNETERIYQDHRFDRYVFVARYSKNSGERAKLRCKKNERGNGRDGVSFR